MVSDENIVQFREHERYVYIYVHIKASPQMERLSSRDLMACHPIRPQYLPLSYKMNLSQID